MIAEADEARKNPEDPLLQFLGEGQRLKFVPFGGSGGDRLLQWCEQRLIEESASELVVDDPDCLCYHGGGLFGYYDDVSILEAVPPGPEPLVFFPRACCWRGDLQERYVREFERMGRRLIIFARDPVSYVHFKDLQAFVEVDLRLSHDAAILYASVFDIDKPMLMTVFRDPMPDVVAVYRRCDEEALAWPEFSVDGMTCLHHDPADIGFLSPEHTDTEIGHAAYLAYWWSCYFPGLVLTDRLHVAIARWLWNFDTILFPGVEHKIEAAWEHSMRDDPRGVVYADTLDQLRFEVEGRGLTLQVQRRT